MHVGGKISNFLREKCMLAGFFCEKLGSFVMTTKVFKLPNFLKKLISSIA